MNDKHMCEKTSCDQPAIGIIGVAFYPPKAVLEYYKTDQELTRMALGLEVCRTHFDEFDIYGDLLDVKSPKGDKTNLEIFAGLLERSAGTAVDRRGCRKVVIGYESEEYKVLLRSKSEGSNAPA